MTDLGDRYYVGPHFTRYAVYDAAITAGEPLSLHASRLDALAECARRNAEYRGGKR